MTYRLLIFLSTAFLILSTTTAQQPYIVTKAPFSTDRYDEFAPAWYKDGIVFCTNRSTGATSYSTSDNRSFFKLFMADTSVAGRWHSPVLFSKEIRTRLNDGPASINSTYDTVYFSRNIITDDRIKSIAPSRNKLGIYYAVFDGLKWARIREIRFNSEWYNVTMPCLSPDGKRLYFVTDRPDSYGGSDIYYSQWRNGYWEDPVNLGSVINTEGNETYPFINEAGELFFASDGHPGLGGKDIFVTKQMDGRWYPPIGLDAPINSEYDDFGLITFPQKEEGLFSSNRAKTIDIYSFTSDVPHIWFPEPQKENKYCFTITDTGSIQVDTLRLQYAWDFGDGTKRFGTKVGHCFPGPGSYSINLDITDKRTGNLFLRKLTYDIEVVDNDQPYITSTDYALTGEAVEFDGLKSYCPGYNILEYYWDFGDQSQGTGERISYAFDKSGEYNITLGVMLQSQNTGQSEKRAVSKKINVFNNEPERTAYVEAKPVIEQDFTDIRQFENVIVKKLYSAENDIQKDALFQVEILSSQTRRDLGSSFFKNVPLKYRLREAFDTASGSWSYFIDQQMSLMSTYNAYIEMIAAGFPETRVRTKVIEDPSEKELFRIVKTYGMLADDYFDSRNQLVTTAYLMLDQVVLLMNKFPEISLDIEVHTDNQGVAVNLMSLSQSRASEIMNYLISRGISSSRLSAKGYGGTRPVGSNTSLSDRRLNRRIHFIISLE